MDRINKQLGDFYGPLYSLLKSNQQAWLSFRHKYKPSGSYFDPQNPPTEEQLIAWRHYMKVVFMPANEKIYDIIVSKSDLLIENDMPKCLLNLISHIIVYRAVIKDWELGNTNENTSTINFPDDAREYVYEAFEKLKKEQFKLLHRANRLNKISSKMKFYISCMVLLLTTNFLWQNSKTTFYSQAAFISSDSFQPLITKMH